MSWRRFAPTTYTKAHRTLCWGTGGLADHGINFVTEESIDCGTDGTFQVDIYIYPKVIVEVDGASHTRERRREKDAWKDRVLAKHGFLVVRITEQEIQKELAGCVARIQTVVEGVREG